jgi:DMSO/TMAO reductase YedYZ heme-binding membrane subunit
MRRLQHHVALAALSTVGIGLIVIAGPEASTIDAVSISSAYLCLGLLCAGMMIGPVHALRTGRPLLNNYLRRDIGIWATLNGLIHFYTGNVVAMSSGYMEKFVRNAELAPTLATRDELFNWGAITGLIIAVLFLLLLALSSDVTLRFVGARWWKRLHRASYFAFILTAIHGVLFQVLESRTPALIALVTIASLGVISLQIAGIRAVQRAA